MDDSQDHQTAGTDGGGQVSARTDTLAEVIDWLQTQADREWENAKNGLGDEYGGFDACLRAIRHCQDMLADEATKAETAPTVEEPCPDCARLPEEPPNSAYGAEGRPGCVTFWENVYHPDSPVASLEGFRPISIGHPFPLLFGDCGFKVTGHDGRKYEHYLSIGYDDLYVYLRVIGLDKVSHVVRLTRSAASYLGDNLVCEFTPKGVRKDCEDSIARELERMMNDPKADPTEYARRIYHHITDCD